LQFAYKLTLDGYLKFLLATTLTWYLEDDSRDPAQITNRSHLKNFCFRSTGLYELCFKAYRLHCVLDNHI